MLPTDLQPALRNLLKWSHAVPLPDSCTLTVLNFMRRDTWGTTEYLCSSYYPNVLLYGSHGENYSLDALLHLAMNPGTQTHPQCPSLLSFAQDLLISSLSYTVHVSACMHTHMYFHHTALSISSAEYLLISYFGSSSQYVPHKKVLWISCSTGIFGWSNSVGNSISCFFLL